MKQIEAYTVFLAFPKVRKKCIILIMEKRKGWFFLQHGVSRIDSLKNHLIYSSDQRWEEYR
jgi:hypothetical protein